MKTIAIINQKGGCGKTTTAINLAGCFAAAGWRTLLVDMDPQSHCAAGLAIPEQRIDLTIADAMLAAEDDSIPPATSKAWVDPSRVLWRVSRNLDLAPSTLKLAALEAARGDLAGKPDAERRLARALARLNAAAGGKGYDLCLLDCSPAFGLLAYNSLAAAQEVIIPVETGFFSLQGSTKQVSTIKSLAKRLGVTPNHRLLATMHDPGSVLARDLLEELHRRFPGRVIPQVIRHDSSLREAASFGQPVCEYAPESIGARDYEALAAWLAEQGLAAPSGETIRPLRAQSAEESIPTTAGSPVQVVSGIADRTLDAARPLPPPTTHPTPPPASPLFSTAPAAQAVLSNTQSESILPAATATAECGMGAESPRAGVPVVVDELKVPSRTADLVERAKRMGTPKSEREPLTPAVNSFVRTTPDLALPGVQIEHVPQRELEAEPLVKAESASPISRTTEPVTFRALGVHQDEQGVWFVQPASAGQELSVAGDFNGWSAEASPMRLNRELGVYELCLPLRAGAVQYRLVVDNNWVADPYNPLVATNPFGEANSVVVVRERKAKSIAASGW